MYSLVRPTVYLHQQMATIEGAVNCSRCPYGAMCQSGVWNVDGFWGEISRQTELEMYLCPQDYCSSNISEPVAYDACADNRMGVLCGRCTEGYSESLYGTSCVPNEDCGLQNWGAILLIIFYGIFYVLFFMFEPEWSSFLKMLTKKVTCSGDDPDREQASEGGYLPIFLYFIQIVALLRISIVFDSNSVYQASVYRPSDVMSSSIMEGIENAFDTDVLSFYQAMCFTPGVTPVTKTGFQLAFVAYLYGILLIIYVCSGFCLVCMSADKRPRIGRLTLNGRVLLALTSLFLYTYENIAENVMSILNCVPVGNQTVLFIDGNVTCPQPWQSILIILMCVYIIPFFMVLFLAPRLLEKQLINLPVFFLSFILPLLGAVPLFLLFIKQSQRTKHENAHSVSNVSQSQTDSSDTVLRTKAEDRASQTTAEIEDRLRSVSQIGDDNDSRLATQHHVTNSQPDFIETDDMLAESLNGPYRADIWRGVCWEGMMNFRRLVMVAMYTFINNILLRQLALSLACFIFLMINIRIRPFKQYLANQFENVSLSLLLIIAVINIVKAALYITQTIPGGPVYVVVAVEEWLEDLCIILLPVLVLIFIILAMVTAPSNQKKKPVKQVINDESSKPPPSRPDSQLSLTFTNTRMANTSPCACYTCRSSNYTQHTF